jgi:hypothetical protein
MLFKKNLKKTSLCVGSIVLGFLCVIPPVSARVDRTIQKAFEQLYEDKIFILRVDLSTFEANKRTVTFETDMYSFIYEKAEGSPEVVFPKGTRVLIRKVDFDNKTIEIEFEAVQDGKRGEVVFDFGERLSDAFSEKREFTTRYDQIFLPDELKKELVFTDTISTIIESGRITVGDTTEDLLLTLGEPSDIVKRVSADSSVEEWWYTHKEITYQFIFEDDELQEWTAHQERDARGRKALFQTDRL